MFPLTNEKELENHISVLLTSCSSASSNTLALHYDSTIGSIYVNWILVNENTSGKAVKGEGTVVKCQRKQVENIKHGNLFDDIFGKFEQKWPIEVQASCAHTKNGDRITYYPVRTRLFFANYFSSTLNAAHIKIQSTSIAYPHDSINGMAIQEHRKYRNEIFMEYEFIDKAKT